jgi:hypothetical protein
MHRIIFLLTAMAALYSSLFSVAAVADSGDQVFKVYHLKDNTPANEGYNMRLGADISGASCDDLHGIIYPHGNEAKPMYSGPLYCLPYVRDISAYLQDQQIVSIAELGIALPRGPKLLVSSSVNIIWSTIVI